MNRHVEELGHELRGISRTSGDEPADNMLTQMPVMYFPHERG